MEKKSAMQRDKKIPEHEFVLARRRVLQKLGFISGAVVTGLAVPWRLMADHAKANQAKPMGAPAPAFRVGKFNKIYDPSEGEKDRWYINDHTFIRAEDGQWHLFGITHREPANAQQEKFLAHATAHDLMGPWKKRSSVLSVDEKKNETVVWAPYVLRHAGLYWMYYCAGGKDHRKYHIHLATSPDLWNWKRHPANPMVADGYDARDPMVLPFGDHASGNHASGNQWLLYYCATSTPEGGNHTVKVAASRDLSHWANPREVFRDAEAGTFGGPTESPFVVARNEKYYLFVCTNRGYNETAVYASETPFHWDAANLVGKFPAHAAEVIQTADGKWFVSRAGWGQGGVYLAELTWED
jgi:arabinan endo-1,5-alpha-L-arabinosidase